MNKMKKMSYKQIDKWRDFKELPQLESVCEVIYENSLMGHIGYDPNLNGWDYHEYKIKWWRYVKNSPDGIDK